MAMGLAPASPSQTSLKFYQGGDVPVRSEHPEQQPAGERG